MRTFFFTSRVFAGCVFTGNLSVSGDGEGTEGGGGVGG